MVTIQDVARHAKVGAATVSRVLNESGYVKEETREKVLRAIDELNYTPNEVARNLYHRKTGIVAILVPEVSHPYFAEFINAAEIALLNQGLQCMICNTWREKNAEAYYIDILKQQRVDGIITGVHSLDVKQYQGIDRPIVALDRILGERIPCVAVDHEKGGRVAAEELIAAGCKSVLQCTGVSKVSSPSNTRHGVFRKTMEEHGITCYDHVSKWNGFNREDYFQAADEITDKYPDVDGFFATDIMAMALIKYAVMKGRRYPEDFKVVAYDGTYLSEMIYPRLTTIVQPINQLAATCVDLLVDLINGKVPEQKNIRLDIELRRGESTTSF